MDINILPKDTTLEAARIRFSILRKMGLEGRAKMAIELSDGLRAIIESGVRRRHPEYDEETVAKKLRDHALFISFAPADEPRIAVAVIVENGGHGGSTAAPIARKVMDAYLLKDN